MKHNTLLLIRFYQVENIKSITIFNSIRNALGRMEKALTDRKVRYYDGQGLIKKIWAASIIGQNRYLKKKKWNQKFHHPLFNPFSKRFASL